MQRTERAADRRPATAPTWLLPSELPTFRGPVRTVSAQEFEIGKHELLGSSVPPTQADRNRRYLASPKGQAFLERNKANRAAAARARYSSEKRRLRTIADRQKREAARAAREAA